MKHRKATTPPSAFGAAKIILGLVASAGALVSTAVAEPRAPAADYPPVSYLQDHLPLHPGNLIGKLIPWNGRMLQPRYLSGRHNGNGVYSVKLKLDER